MQVGPFGPWAYLLLVFGFLPMPVALPLLFPLRDDWPFVVSATLPYGAYLMVTVPNLGP